MNMYNPDFPSDEGLNFLQYTYQNRQNMYNYWGGMSNPYMNPYANMDSRRNVSNPVNPFNTFGQVQPGSIPMNQPTGTYPTNMPMGNASGGLNSFINDSRRNMPQQTTSNNPWAPQQQMAPQMNQQPNYSPFAQTPYSNNPWSGMFDYGAGNGYQFNTKMNFDTKNSWDNYYTQPRMAPMPVIDWRQSNMPAPNMNPYQQPAQPQYPTQQIQTSQPNWRDIAERNWKNSNI